LKPLPVVVQDASPEDRRSLAANNSYLQKLVRIQNIRILGPGEAAPVSATALLGEMKILVPMADLIDVAAERDRLGKALAKCQGDLARIEGKLANRQFVDNAPPAVVGKEREKLRVVQQESEQLREQLAKLAHLG
jgi:valyl-tRNA synthetase